MVHQASNKKRLHLKKQQINIYLNLLLRSDQRFKGGFYSNESQTLRILALQESMVV